MTLPLMHQTQLPMSKPNFLCHVHAQKKNLKLQILLHNQQFSLFYINVKICFSPYDKGHV